MSTRAKEQADTWPTGVMFSCAATRHPSTRLPAFRQRRSLWQTLC